MAGLSVNVNVALLVLMSTSFACEHWRRQGRLFWQVSIRTILGLIAAVAFILHLHHAAIVGFMHGYYFIRGRPWYVDVPLTFGVVCVGFVISWLTLDAAATLLRKRQ